MQEQFHRAAVTDSLTGVANRRRLMDELEHRTGAPYLRLQSRPADRPAVLSIAGGTLGIALACVLLSFMMMITARRPCRR